MSEQQNPPRLIADIGGTNARFALIDGDERHDEVVLACADYPDVVSAIEHYLDSVGAAKGAARPIEGALAIAGPITGDLVHLTNHAWQFSAARTRQALGWRRLIMLNDFTALAMAIRHLPREEIEQIGGGQSVPDMPLALLGQWIALQGEGGHQTLPVMNEREAAMLGQLRQRFSHVSAERVLSGPGLVNLYDALCGLEGIVPKVLTPPEITRRAREGSCRICLETVSMFCALLGTLAGNLVLTLGAVGGCYIGGGIVPGLGSTFASSHFRDRFEDKGRYTDYLSRVPTYVIRSELPAFIGLAAAFTAPGPRWEAE